MNACLEIKRGGTLDIAAQVQEDGQPVDINGWGIACWVRDGMRRRIHEFVPQIDDVGNGKYSLSAGPAQTQDWPSGDLRADLRYTDPLGAVSHSESFVIRVIDPETGG